MDLHRPCKVSPQSVAIRVREERQSVRISPAHRTADPAIETLCAGAHAQPRTGRRSGAGHAGPRSDQGTILTPTGRAANTGRINNPWLPGAAMARPFEEISQATDPS